MIKAIFAVDQNGGMGASGSLPWPHCSEDFQFFKRNTEGDIVVMGSKTWNDPKMPKPLPGRMNFVITNRTHVGHGAIVIRGDDICEQIQQIAQAYPDKTVWIIGGANILDQTRDLIDEIYLTHFKGSYRVDTRVDLKKYLLGFTPKSASVSEDRQCTWVIYKNENISRST